MLSTPPINTPTIYNHLRDLEDGLLGLRNVAFTLLEIGEENNNPGMGILGQLMIVQLKQTELARRRLQLSLEYGA